MTEEKGYWSQKSQKRRALFAGLLMTAIGLYILFFTDNSADGYRGTPGPAVPWIIIGCGLALVVLSRGKRLR